MHTAVRCSDAEEGGYTLYEAAVWHLLELFFLEPESAEGFFAEVRRQHSWWFELAWMPKMGGLQACCTCSGMDVFDRFAVSFSWRGASCSGGGALIF